MHEGKPIKSHIAEFFSIINDFDEIKVKIEDDDQALLFMCSLPSSYESFRKVIIYGGKSTIKVNEDKEHLLNKNKIDTQLMVSLIMIILGKFIIQGRKVIMKVSWVTQNTKI